MTDALAIIEGSVDLSALVVIDHERERATRRLQQDRDFVTWAEAMARLDQQEAQVRANHVQPVTAREVAADLGNMSRLYGLAEPGTQRRIVQALFERVEVLGPHEVWLVPSEEAIARGWAAAMTGEFRVELRQSGRGERI